jgi:hypothetical protein
MTSPTVVRDRACGMTALPPGGPRQAAIGLTLIRRPAPYADPITRADTDPTRSGTCLNRVPLNDTDVHDHELPGRTQPVHAAEAPRMGRWSA